MEYKITVENIKCTGCTSSILKELEPLKGVDSVDVTLEGLVSFECTEDLLPIVINKLAEIGHPKKKPNNLLDKAKNYLNNN